MDAMKSFAGQSVPDIEDLDGWVKVCPLRQLEQEEDEVRVLRTGGRTWARLSAL